MYPIAELYMGMPIHLRLKELEKTQWLSPKDIESYQLKKLRSLVKYAYENVPYYHELFKKNNISYHNIKNKSDLSRIPILTKEIIRTNFPDNICSKNINFKKVKLIGTSGSTAKQLFLYRDRSCQSWHLAAYDRFLRWMGVNIGDKTAELWGNPTNIKIEKKLINRLTNYLTNNLFLPAFNLNENTFKIYIQKLKKYHPKVLIGYTTPLILMARFIKQESIDITIKNIVTTAENLTCFDRKLIEEQFQGKVHDQYGCGEVNSIAFECPAHEGYHITDEHVIVEFMRDDFISSSDKNLGKIIITDLDNYATPIIRYENGDIGIPSPKHCSCGRGLSMIKEINGRMNEVVITPSGRYILPQWFYFLFENEINVEQFQIIQDKIDHIIVKIIPRENFNKKNEKKIYSALIEYIGKDVGIEIKCVEKLPKTISGKRQSVISKIKK